MKLKRLVTFFCYNLQSCISSFDAPSRTEQLFKYTPVCGFLLKIDFRCNKYYTANFLSVKIVDVCLRSKLKNKHLLFLHFFLCDLLQIFSRCFQICSGTEFNEK